MKTNKKKAALPAKGSGKGKGKGDLSANDLPVTLRGNPDTVEETKQERKKKDLRLDDEVTAVHTELLKDDIKNDILKTEVNTHIKKRTPLHQEGGIIGDIEDDTNPAHLPDGDKGLYNPPLFL